MLLHYILSSIIMIIIEYLSEASAQVMRQM